MGDTYKLTDPAVIYFLTIVTFKDDTFVGEYLLEVFYKSVGYD